MKTHTLLAVDDRAENLFVVKQLIAEHLPECGLVTAQSAEAGLALAAEQSFDGALIDVQMPGVDGLEMCRRLKADQANLRLPILLMTAHGSTADSRIHGLAAGADDFISRPIDNFELVAKIQVMLRIKRAEDELRAVNEHLEELVAERTSELRDSEVRYRAIFEQAADSILVVDVATGAIVDFNERAHQNLGYTREEFKSLKVSDFEAVESPQHVAEHTEAIIKEGADTFETKHRTKDGRIRDILVSSRAVTIGNRDYAVGIWRDITERKRAQEEINSARNELERFFALVPDMVCIASTDGYFKKLNKAWTDTLGFTEEELLSRPFIDFIHPDDVGATLREVEKQIAGDITASFVNRYRKKDGKYRWFEWMATPAEENLLFAAARDITQRKRAEEQLSRAKEAAEAASRVKSQFLANMSHEIRTPMAAIMGYTDLLLSQEWPPAERREHLQVVSRQSQHLLAIINNILDLSMIESEETKLELTECSVSEIVEDVRSLLQVNANEKQLGLEIHYRKPLPRTIRTDADRLRQILVNLVGNAVKFTEKGGVKITLGCTRQEDGAARMQFEVADTGIGIRSEEIDRLFEPFTQADMTFTRRFGGTGLGLAISQRLAQLLGGRIEVESRPGKGSVFLLTIDAGPLDNLSMAPPPDARRVETQQPAQRRPRQRLTGFVLLAEDDPDLQAMLERNLQALGLEVETAENGRIAWEKALASRAAARPYGLILMDIQMPDLDGHEATRRLRRDGWDGPIVAVTAHAMDDDRQKCLKAGCDDYVSKPVTTEELFSTVARYLGAASPSEPSARLPSGPPPDPQNADLVETFLSGLSTRMENMERASRAGDFSGLGKLAHQLKGTAGGFGFPAIALASRQLVKQTGEGNDLRKLEDTLSELKTLCKHVLENGDTAVLDVARHDQPAR